MNRIILISVKLSNGVEMPILGYGVYQIVTFVMALLIAILYFSRMATVSYD